MRSGKCQAEGGAWMVRERLSQAIERARRLTLVAQGRFPVEQGKRKESGACGER